MPRNDETMVYGIPQLYHERYFHPYSVRRKTTGNVGQIKPIYYNLLVQPGDTISIDMQSFVKMTTSKFPSMDVLCADVYAFAEDWQNVWDHTKEFWGEDEATPFEELTEYTIPQLVIKPTDAVENGDIINDLSMPIMEAGKGSIATIERTKNIEVERLGLNTYYDIYNRYFRDQNYIEKIQFSKGDEDIDYSDLTQKKLLKAARLHDYFAGTPEAQRGEPERIALGTTADVTVFGNGNTLGLTNGTDNVGLSAYNNSSTQNHNIFQPNAFDTAVSTTGIDASGPTGIYGVTTDPEKSGLIGLADLSSAMSATINSLRYVTALQQIKEELMWYGSRFEEIITSQWGVENNPTAFRIPEYLGGKRFYLNMDTVLQTSQTTTGESGAPLGDSAGYSTTYNEQFLFTKSFATWQHIMILVVIRQDHSYAQGIGNQYLKKRKYDFYWDKFKGLGAQPRKTKEICVNGTDDDENIWNFAPAFREYTSEVDRATGLMQPGIQDTLANYTYTDEYTAVPSSGQSWIEETPDYVDRTLVVPSSTTDQFIMDFVFNIKKTSIIPNYRLPGLDKL